VSRVWLGLGIAASAAAALFAGPVPSGGRAPTRRRLPTDRPGDTAFAAEPDFSDGTCPVTSHVRKADPRGDLHDTTVADLIEVEHDGRVVEVGTHGEPANAATPRSPSSKPATANEQSFASANEGSDRGWAYSLSVRRFAEVLLWALAAVFFAYLVLL
jgi:hypothetical protein